jgi:hypothetical protein
MDIVPVIAGPAVRRVAILRVTRIRPDADIDARLAFAIGSLVKRPRGLRAEDRIECDETLEGRSLLRAQERRNQVVVEWLNTG